MESTERQKEIQDSQLCHRVMYTYNLIVNLKIKERRAAKIYHCNWLAKVLGVKLCLITLRTRHHSARNVISRWHLRLPLGLGHVVTGDLIMRDSWLSFPRLGLKPQNIIPPDSEIIKACEADDITGIRNLVGARAAHPNDRTPDNLTVFRVS